MKSISCLLLTLQFACYNLYAQTPVHFRDSTRGPQTFAMIVGISHYKYIRPLTYADKDAELFRDYLLSPGGGSVKPTNIFCLLNEQAINSNFWSKGFQWLKAKQLQRGDKLFIYLAGHGDAIDEDQFFFLGYDCNPGGDKNNYLVSGAIQLFNLKKKIANETSRGVEVVFIMDACRSHELPGGTQGQNFLNTAVSEKQAGEIIMLATGAGQESLEDVSIGNGHGLFTWYLVDGLNGLADSLDTPDQRISFREIQSYVNRNVPTVAAQRFNRKQEPYFCCTENSEKIISAVDTSYLSKWIRMKKGQKRGPGNSINNWTTERLFKEFADTSLIETYNRFNTAVKNNQITGKNSAEELYAQLSKKFPGNPYTLDAKSTLSVEFINFGQNLINNYIGCVGDEKNLPAYQQAGNLMEKAIEYVREDDEDFALSLRGRMYFLKASGKTSIADRFSNAYKALAIDPKGAYILNRLALLHMENRNRDSALYYATKTVEIAPNWICGVTTLSYVKQQEAGNNNVPVKKLSRKKISFGIHAGAGSMKPDPHYNVSDWRQGNANYTDSLTGITGSSKTMFSFGVLIDLPLGNAISIRPGLQLSMENGDINYLRKERPGSPAFTETIPLDRMAIELPLPVIIRLSQKNFAPYLLAAPVAQLFLKDKNATNTKLPLRNFGLQATGGIGVDIGLSNGGLILSPEIRYNHGLTDMKEDANNIYTNTLSSLQKKGFVFMVVLRRG